MWGPGALFFLALQIVVQAYGLLNVVEIPPHRKKVRGLSYLKYGLFEETI